MPSYQDIETRLIVCEDKLDLIMKAFTVTKRTESIIMPGEFTVESKTLLDIYHEMKSNGVQIINATEKRELIDGN